LIDLQKTGSEGEDATFEEENNEKNH